MSSTNTLKLIAAGSLVLLAGCLSQTDPVDDGAGSADSTGPTNGSPTISGTAPGSNKVGEMYSFTPTASDPDGDPLTFSIQNRPSWANFDASTGNISGIPTLGDVGVYNNIMLSVSDGSSSASLRQFGISVDQIGATSTSLSWLAPVRNEDGTTLTDLAGYKIFFGRSSGSYDNEIRIDNPGISYFVVDGLTPNTYYFAIAAFNSQGIDSALSAEAVKSLN